MSRRWHGGARGAACLIAAAVCWAAWAAWGSFDGGRTVWPTAEAARGELSIGVTARGTLFCQQETPIVCNVWSLGNNDGVQIVQLAPNGKRVAKGELLIEFDSAAIRDRVDSQRIAVARAEAKQISSNAQYENQLVKNETLLADAAQAIQLAEWELEMYDDGQNGTFQLALAELDRVRQDARNGIAQAEAELAMRVTERNGIEQLFKLGYRGRTDLDQALFSALQAENELSAATNTLANAASNVRKLETFESPLARLQLESNLEVARKLLAQTKLDNAASLVMAEARKIEANETLARYKRMDDAFKWQLENCCVYAPHDGLVVYKLDDGEAVIYEGAFCRTRQVAMTLPALDRMAVRTEVHESVYRRVQPGLEAAVRVEIDPDRVYHGVVSTVSPVADNRSSFSAGVRLYPMNIVIEETVEGLRPGMTAVVDVHVDRLPDLLLVPVEAVVETAGGWAVFVDAGARYERRAVTIGEMNDQYVEIVDGLAAGERVVREAQRYMDQDASMAALAAAAR